jgi:hypothetical protein
MAARHRRHLTAPGFWIFDGSLAALEIPTASLEITRPQEVELYSRMFEHLQGFASYGPAARALVIKALDELMPQRYYDSHSA